MPRHEDRDRAYWDDIVESCSLIVSRIKGKKFPDLVSDRSLQDGVVLRLIIIGEAAKNLSLKGKAKYPDVEWKNIGRLRDLVVHHYWDLDLPMIWEVARKDIPSLLKTLT